MANRAYLFSSDSDPNEPTSWVNLGDNGSYYDSRHGIPLAWFFFFRPDDVKTMTVYGRVAFMTSKTEAIQRFVDRESLLAEVVGPRLYNEAFDSFLPKLRSQSGSCLCLDASEIFEDGEEDAEHSRHILNLIGAASPDLTEIKKALSHYCWTQYQDEGDFIMNVLGATYC